MKISLILSALVATLVVVHAAPVPAGNHKLTPAQTGEYAQRETAATGAVPQHKPKTKSEQGKGKRSLIELTKRHKKDKADAESAKDSKDGEDAEGTDDDNADAESAKDPKDGEDAD
ncbi:hypothetical protein BGZ83_000229, partial [Gryganskiella cystojenkinii]